MDVRRDARGRDAGTIDVPLDDLRQLGDRQSRQAPPARRIRRLRIAAKAAIGLLLPTQTMEATMLTTARFPSSTRDI